MSTAIQFSQLNFSLPRSALALALKGGLCLLALQTPLSADERKPYFKITVIDDVSGTPVPMVELTTLHRVRFVTDNAGVICFDLPELMGRETWFHVQGHGYSVPKDGFGYRGVRLLPKNGEEATVRVHREFAAERVGRLTGAGLLAESQRFGLYPSWTDQGILGCDSVQNVFYRGKLYWFWGDTTLAHYPLGRFHMIGATTKPEAPEVLSSPLMQSFDYFTDPKGIPRNVAEIPGEGPTWLTGFVSLPDANGVEHLGATYLKIQPPLSPYRIGLCQWDDVVQSFKPLKTLWEKEDNNPNPPEDSYPHGHPVQIFDDSGRPILLFGDPFPNLQCEAKWESWADPRCWKSVPSQSRVPVKESQRVEAKAHSAQSQSVQPQSVQPHRGAIIYSKYLSKWLCVFNEWNGYEPDGIPSPLGQVWLALSESPRGTWTNAVKIATHHRHSFYNPQIHESWSEHDSRWLYFEGTFTVSFTDNDAATPRYEYNQILYRLDLENLRTSMK